MHSQLHLNTFLLLFFLFFFFFRVLGSLHTHTNTHKQRLTNKAQLMLWLNGQRNFEWWFIHVSFVVVVVLVVPIVVLVLLLLTILFSCLYYSFFFGVLFLYSYEFQRCAFYMKRERKGEARKHTSEEENNEQIDNCSYL